MSMRLDPNRLTWNIHKALPPATPAKQEGDKDGRAVVRVGTRAGPPEDLPGRGQIIEKLGQFSQSLQSYSARNVVSVLSKPIA